MIDKTLELLKSYLTTNAVGPEALPQLIKAVYTALTELEKPPAAEQGVDWKSTITADYLVCLEDGRKLKILKRHLRQTYGMTPEEYCKKWGLPSDYPMVAQSYGAARSQIAKNQGLGKR